MVKLRFLCGGGTFRVSGKPTDGNQGPKRKIFPKVSVDASPGALDLLQLFIYWGPLMHELDRLPPDY